MDNSLSGNHQHSPGNQLPERQYNIEFDAADRWVNKKNKETFDHFLKLRHDKNNNHRPGKILRPNRRNQ